MIDCELIRCQDDQQRELIGERVILQRRLDKTLGYSSKTLDTGILLGDKRLKMSLFADDALVFLDGSVSQFEIISRKLATFGSISGLVVNYTKSKAFYLGSFRGNATKPSSEKDLQWLSEDDNLKYMGITIPIKRSVDNQTVLRVNFENTLAQIKTVLNMGKIRGLTQ